MIPCGARPSHCARLTESRIPYRSVWRIPSTKMSSIWSRGDQQTIYAKEAGGFGSRVTRMYRLVPGAPGASWGPIVLGGAARFISKYKVWKYCRNSFSSTRLKRQVSRSRRTTSAVKGSTVCKCRSLNRDVVTIQHRLEVMATCPTYHTYYPNLCVYPVRAARNTTVLFGKNVFGFRTLLFKM